MAVAELTMAESSRGPAGFQPTAPETGQARRDTAIGCDAGTNSLNGTNPPSRASAGDGRYGKDWVAWLDYARALAICLVLMTHAIDRSPELSVAYHSLTRSIDRMGVPLFFMISGCLILPKAIGMTWGGFYAKYAKRIIHFALLTGFFSILTNTVSNLCNGMGAWNAVYGAAYLHNFIFNGSYGYAWQLWYMPAIMGLYMLTPIFASMLRGLSARTVCCICALCLLPLTNIPLLKESLGPYTHVYCAYFVAGYLLSPKVTGSSTGSRPGNICLVSAIILIWGLACIVDCRAGGLQKWLHWYDCSLPLFITSFCAILLIRNWLGGRTRVGAAVSSLSRCSFGIYLWHYAILYCLLYWLPANCQSTAGVLAHTACCFLVPLALSWLLTWACSRIPVVRCFMP